MRPNNTYANHYYCQNHQCFGDVTEVGVAGWAWLVSWSLTSLFCTNMAISETRLGVVDTRLVTESRPELETVNK